MHNKTHHLKRKITLYAIGRLNTQYLIVGTNYDLDIDHQYFANVEQLVLSLDVNAACCSVYSCEYFGELEKAAIDFYLTHAHPWHGLIVQVDWISISDAVNLMKSGVIDIITPADPNSNIVDRLTVALKRMHAEQETNQQANILPLLEKLTPCEQQILALIGKGFSSQDISHQYLISRKTVDLHRASLRRKLNQRSSRALITLAAQISSHE
ncbi:FixJ family two-component response regulator [Brevundimonas vesicularis]|uniref:LuxR C-terminal-related transcriptional regulator n=1 Tax=Brevundimonas vesicularis TaxID=41276 RepID=UPI0018EC4BDC|nr:LuxR C-terminal-related transcriptional regulator [Brevundimonas vesicularis]MDQ1193849.1 FixJ family two-component response regulator [Brevundimonas vesicularis]